MCLGRICRVVDVEPDATAIVDDGDSLSTVSLLALPATAGVGDWVVVHSGLAVAVLTADEARDALSLRGADAEGDAR